MNSIQKPVRYYDFRNPDRLAKEQARTLELFFGHYARSMQSYLTTLFRSVVEVSVGSVRQMSFEEFTMRIRPPISLALVELLPFRPRFAILIDTMISSIWIDKLLGGTGGTVILDRDLTEIEQRLVVRVHQGTLVYLREAFASVSSFDPHIIGMETQAPFTQIISPVEVGLSIEFTVEVDGTVGKMMYLFPFPLLMAILPTHGTELKEANAPELIPPLKNVRVSLSVPLGKAHLKVREVMELEEGDLIPLDQSIGSLFPLLVEGQVKYHGKVGLKGKRLAIAIEEVEGANE